MSISPVKSGSCERERKEKKVKLLSRVRLFATPWTVAYLPGSSVHGIFQARILEWVAISFSRTEFSKVSKALT